MSAQILPFAKPFEPTPNPSLAATKHFAPGQHVIIDDYSWDRGETEIPAVVISHAGDWVAVRVPDTGSYSVHESCVHEAPEPEAA